MMVNANNEYVSKAEYFYNKYIGMYCIIGTTHSSESLSELEEMFESADLMEETEMPDYITEDYEGPTW